MKKIDKMTYASNQNLKERDYWLKKLAGTLVKSVFPYDYNINITNINVGLNEDKNREVVKFKMAGELYSRLTRICGGDDAKLHVILATGIVVLLGRYSGNNDIIVGIPIYKQDMDADFINMVLALRNQIRHDITFKEMILQVHESVFEAIENQNYPLETLLHLLNIPYSEKENRFPLFDIAVLLKNIHDERYIQDIPLNLIFSFLRTGDSIEGRAEFNSLVYEKSTIERIIRHFRQFLQKSLFDADIPLGGIDILADEERKRLLFDFNDTDAQYPRDKTIHKLFAQQVEKRPDSVAVVGLDPIVGARHAVPLSTGYVSITYKELNEKSNRLARLLRKKGINPDANPIVGIMAEPSIEMIAGIIGILNAGGAYLPLDPEYPEERIKYMLEDSGAKIMLTGSAAQVKAEVKVKEESIETIDISKGLSFSTSTLTSTSSPAASADGLAYIIYTSGTTGKPKGTLIEHRNVVRLMFNDNYLFDFNHHDVWTMFHSLCFDFSVWEIYGALLYGGKLVLIPKMTARDPGKYLDVLKKEIVTVLNQTPSAFHGLSDEDLKFPGKELYLRYIIFGGEALKPFKLKRWQEKYPETRLINMYGITETTVHVTFKEITVKDIETDVSNIGKPIPTLTAYILDSYLQPSPIGVGGEICVGGEGVGRGYLNRPELTGEKFIPDPYGPGKRMYKSGDLGRRLPNGEIEYMGRIDHQVKVRGFRIELGEIESRLLKYKEVKETVVIARESGTGNKHLCAYVVADGKIAVSDLREYLSNQLPDYMIPSYFVQLEKIPLTLNGKVDRKKLPAPSRDEIDMGVVDPPKTELEEKLVNIWKNVLELEQLGVKENFFRIGGDSIKAIKLVNSINSELQLPANIRLADIYLNETIEKLSLLISQNKTDTQEHEFMDALREIEAFKNRILAKAAAGETPAVLADADIEDLYPMSDIEKGMIYHSLKDPGRAVYHDQVVHQMTYVDFDPVRFKKAVVLMVKKHPILRTSFHMGDFEEGIQVVHKYKEDYLDIRHYDISGMERQEQEAYLRKFIIEDRQKPFNFSVPSLWRLRTFALDKDNIIFLWVCHHGIIDGWSDASFKTELNNLYLKLNTEPEFVPGKLKSSYKDFIIEQMAYKKKKEIRDFWKNELGDYRRLHLPGTVFNDNKRYNKNDQVISAKTFAADLGTALLNKLNDITAGYNTNLKCLCFNAYMYMLNMITYENDITAGLVVHNRPVIEDGEKILGCFLNSVPVRIKIPTDIRWSDYIRMADEKLMELTKYGQLSLFEIAKIAGEEGRDQNPLFDTIFNFIDFHVYQWLQSGDEHGAVRGYNADSRTISIETQAVTNTWFDFTVDTTGGSLIVIIYYSNEWFDVEMVQKCCDYFKGILDRFVDDPEGLIGKDKILSLEEKELLLGDFNDTSKEYPKDRTIYELFEEQAARTPDGIAVIGMAQIVGAQHAVPLNGNQLTYAELNEKSDRLAHHLRSNGVGPDTIVGIKVERSIEMIFGILGILKAGGAYLPIDPDYPRERIDFMLKDSKASLLLTSEELADVGRGTKFCAPTTRNPHLSLAYVIYTSGTTGQPKGTPVAHRSLVNLCYWHNRYYAVTEKDNATQYANAGFDASVWEIFPYLIKGAAIHIIGEDIKLDMQRLGDYYKKHHVTISFLPTQLCQQFMEEAGEIHSLRCLLTGGDRLNRFVQRGYRLYNNYGPTENTVVTTSCPVEAYKENIPIGKPIDNSRVYILNKDNLQLQPLGVAGELCIAGDSLACGYLNRPELTAERFSTHHSSLMIHRFYRTGDLARWLGDGSIEFLGRIDHQVKVRGFRLELGEIEARLLDIEEIIEAVVLDRTDNTGEKYLCAYIVSSSGLESREIKAALSQMLPGYMIPAYIVQVERIPLTPGGKVDRKALPAPEMGRGAHYIAPGNEVEEKLAEIWGEVLHGIESESVGIDDNFFELGGHSLKAITLAARIHETFNTEVPLEILFRIPTIRGLAEYIAGAAKALFITIQPVEKREYYELSSAQKRLFVIQKIEAGSVVYNIPLALVLEGELDKEHLGETIGKLIQRHESLRTSFEMINQEPVQRVHEDVEFEVDYSDLAAKAVARHPTTKDREEIIKNYIRSFDLSKAPLLRVGLFRLEKQEHVFILDMHHIITDGSSLPVLSKEFIDLYGGKELKPLRIQYRDYAQWQKNQKENLKKQEGYWLNVFAADVPVLNLPTDYPRPAVQSFEGSTFQFTVDRENTQQLREVAANHGATLYMVLLGIFNVLLAKISGQEDIVVGVPIAGRRHVELESIIGMFVNTLAIRNLPSPQKTFDDFLEEVKKQTLGAFENQEHQFEDLVEQVPVNRDVGRNPLFDVMFVLQNVEYRGLEIPGLKLKSYEYETSISKFDLTLTGFEAEESLLFSLEYCTKLFKKETIERFSGYFKKVLSEIVNVPGKQLAGIEIISEVEKNRVLYEFNNTGCEYPGNTTIHQLFEEQAIRTPDHVAVGAQGTVPLPGDHISITYKELNEKSNYLAHRLQEKGVQPDTIVGIKMERSIEMIIAILGILKAGGAYLPVDPDSPKERIDYMLKDSNARVLFKKSEIRISKSETNPNDQNSNDQNEISTPIVLNFEHLNFEFVSNFEFRISDLKIGKAEPSNLAYVIYTSGTTGWPKGTLMEHRSLVNLCYWHNRYYGVTGRDHATQYAGIGFDASVWEIFPYLVKGAAVHIIAESIKLDIDMLNGYYEQHNITISFLPTQLCEQFMEKDNKSLRALLTGGDKLRRFEKKGYDLYNNYGPTENTVVTTAFAVEKPYRNIPIGTPIHNNCIFILNTYDLKLQPIGVWGELCIAGDSLARGYLNRPELTAERFVDYRSNKSYRTYSSSKIYKTGDSARWLADGNIEFLGRIDHQVKIRGFRIEIGEIEKQLLAIDGIKEAVAIDKEDKTGEKYLCAYIVSEEEIDLKGIKVTLSQKLPGYMIPDYYLRLDKFPLTASGKVDRDRLPEPGFIEADVYVAPGNEIEEKLVEIWSDVLGIEKEVVSIESNFFDIGGNSLRLIKINAKIKELFNKDIPITTMFRLGTIRGISAFIQEEEINLRAADEVVAESISAMDETLSFLDEDDNE